MMAETYDPKLFIGGYVQISTSVFANTNWSTDTPTLPALNFMGFKETSFSTDSATTGSDLGFEIVEDTW